MGATIMDGTAVANELLQVVAVDAARFERVRRRRACLATVLVGDDPASHPKTADLAEAVRGADIVIAAVGRSELIRGEWIKPGAVVVDAGYNPGNVGDIEYEAAAHRARLITPVPGGVGPMTIAVLLAQTVQAAFAS